MKKQDLSTLKLPDSPGVYFFLGRPKQGVGLGRGKREILYIGKATSLRDRVSSYFNKELMKQRGLRLVTMITIANTVTYKKTESVLEALLLESKYIKEFSPIYNSREKDNRSFTCVVITKEDFPRVLTMRVREYEKTFSKKNTLAIYGPFSSSSQLREAMKIIRKLFPYRDKCVMNQGKMCFNAQLKLCPGVCIGAISAKEYKGHIDSIRRLFEGKKTEIIKYLNSEMESYVKKHLFEKAGVVRNTLFALGHIKDISLIKEESILSFKDRNFRIEGYDVAHLGGTSRVGAMVVMEGKEKAKSEYRKFKLEEKINDDYEGLRQILLRRFSHKEWRYPDLIVFDGGLAHKQVGEKVLSNFGLSIPCVSVVKDEHHKPKNILGDKVPVDYHKREILLANSEAHRFAIKYHRTLKNKLV